MEYTKIEIVLIISYIVGEIYKLIFKNKKELNKYIPIIVGLVGGVLGMILFKNNTLFINLFIGIITGLSSTGTNQIFKQLKKEN